MPNATRVSFGIHLLLSAVCAPAIASSVIVQVALRASKVITQIKLSAPSVTQIASLA